MAEPAELEALLRLMPPETESDTAVDWDRMTESWGRRFPVAYQRFLAVYGAGMIQNYLVIGAPQLWAEPPDGDSNEMRAGTAFARVLWQESRKEPDLEGTTPRLILWALDSSGEDRRARPLRRDVPAPLTGDRPAASSIVRTPPVSGPGTRSFPAVPRGGPAGRLRTVCPS